MQGSDPARGIPQFSVATRRTFRPPFTDLYALRKTHISWARRLRVNPDSVKVQVGHGPRDIEERHYLDLVDAQASSQAVWDLLTGERTLDARNVEPARASIAVGYDMAGSNPLCNQLAGKAQFPTDKTGLSGTEALGRKEVAMAGTTGLEPATPGSTVRHSSQLSYVPAQSAIPSPLYEHTRGSRPVKCTCLLADDRALFD